MLPIAWRSWLSEIPYYAFTTGEFAGQKDVIISNTGYTGAGGFELYFYPEAGEAIWNAIFEAGAPEGIKPIGLGARDTLRLEMGFCLYGNDLSDTTSPLEAGLGWITKFVEGKDFTARAILEKQKAEGLNRKLVGFEMIDRGIPRHGYELVNAEGEKVGEVTSGTMSPIRKIGIGMGYIQTAYATPGTEVFIDVRGRKLKAMVVKPPFRKYYSFFLSPSSCLWYGWRRFFLPTCHNIYRYAGNELKQSTYHKISR